MGQSCSRDKVLGGLTCSKTALSEIKTNWIRMHDYVQGKLIRNFYGFANFYFPKCYGTSYFQKYN